MLRNREFRKKVRKQKGRDQIPQTLGNIFSVIFLAPPGFLNSHFFDAGENRGWVELRKALVVIHKNFVRQYSFSEILSAHDVLLKK